VNLRNPRFWIMVASTAIVLLVGVVDMTRTSPGPLSLVHQREPRIDGGRSCSECHGGWTSTMTESCLDCHRNIAAQTESGHGLHGILDRTEVARCATCHSDHHGEGFALVGLQSFMRAGIRTPDAFDHSLVGYVMAGRHLELGCTECHEQADAIVLPEGHKRYLGLKRDCSSCHTDPHEGGMDRSCTECHDQTGFDAVSFVPHDAHLFLGDGHEELGCRTCHAVTDAHALERNGRPRLPPRTCQDCHASPHDDEFTRGTARLAAMSVSESCITCHEKEHRSFREKGIVVTREQHAASGFPLDAPHQEVKCSTCHLPADPLFEARYPGRSPSSCSVCHTDPHGEQFESGAFAGKECTSCHQSERFVPHAFTTEKHTLASFRLTGSHVRTECNRCHEVVQPSSPRMFHGTPGTCESCHRDAHRGFFAPYQATLASVEGGFCAHCHSTSRFSELSPGFDHEESTGFALRGAHLENTCESCHARSAEPDETGRSFGAVRDRYGVIEGCSTCHEDPHLGRFDRTEVAATVEGQSGCARCHTETSFREIRGPFDHDKWTGFALRHAHATLDCAACHAPTPESSTGRSHAPARGAHCSDCHQDPHRKQFEREGVTDCQRCHKGEESFKELVFNHDLHARFPLEDHHREAACSACHRLETSGEASFVRYVPTPTECADCHGSQREPLRRRRRLP
jgi:hypothetical protein